MELDKLVAISGRSGIYRMAANRPNGLVVEDLDTGKKTFVSGRIHQFTPLESISIYTSTADETVELKTVFRRMLQMKEDFPPVDAKASAEEVRDYFEEVLPEYDRDRVFVSDIKKLLKWFEFLNERDMLKLASEEEEEAEEVTTEEETE